MQKAVQYTTDDQDIEIKIFGLSLKPTPFDHLVVNHAHCIASHESAEVQSENISALQEPACKYSEETLARTDGGIISVSCSSSLLELC
jgi:hypothetical protein